MIIDSNILIDFLKGNPNAIEFIGQFDAIILNNKELNLIEAIENYVFLSWLLDSRLRGNDLW